MIQLSIRDLLTAPAAKRNVLRMSMPTFLGLATIFSLFGAMIGGSLERSSALLWMAHLIASYANPYWISGPLGGMFGAALVTMLFIRLWVTPARARRRLALAYAVSWLVAFLGLMAALLDNHFRGVVLFAVAPTFATGLAAMFILPGAYEPRAARPRWRWSLSDFLQRHRPTTGFGRALLSPVSIPESVRARFGKAKMPAAGQWVLSFLAPDLAIFVLLLLGCLADPEMCGVGGMFMIGMFYAPYAILVPQMGGSVGGLAIETFFVPPIGMLCHALLGLGFAWLKRGREVSWWSSLSTAFTVQIALVIATFFLLSALGFII